MFILEHRSRVFVNLADVWYHLFCLHFRAAYSTAISAAQACYNYFGLKGDVLFIWLVAICTNQILGQILMVLG